MNDALRSLVACADACLAAADDLDTLEGRQRLSDALDDLAVALVTVEQQLRGA